MPQTISVNQVKEGIRRICKALIDHREELNRIDAQMGDGDIGITVSQGSEQILEGLDAMENDLGKVLHGCAQLAIKGRASSFGTLMATGVMAMAKSGMGKQEISRFELADMLAAAVEKMAARGKSCLGNKTVLDSIDAVRGAIAGSDDSEDLAAVADLAAGDALARFQGQPCKQGRARIFAEKSKGLHDPGMMVIKRMTEALNTGSV